LLAAPLDTRLRGYDGEGCQCRTSRPAASRRS